MRSPSSWSREPQPTLPDILSTLSRCRSARDTWRVRLQAEDNLVPQEMASLIEASPTLPPSAQSWFTQMAMLGQFNQGEPQRFGAEILAPGFPALRYGLMWKADRAISIGGSFAWHPRRLLEEPGNALPAFDPLCACQANTSTALFCAYGARNSKDQEEASRLSSILPVNHIAVPGLSDHNIIKAQANNGSLSAFFNDIFELDNPSATSLR
jgi:hypothetical protein